ncbi:MAG: PD-(D/E)XK nuclease family protein [Gammaproteobacteria bacterium]
MLTPFGEDAHRVLAAQVAARFKAELPDLSRITILLPGRQTANDLRAHLLDEAQRAGHAALLGPRIETLQSWVRSRIWSPLPVLNEQSRELLLVEELRHYPDLFGGADPWQLAASLLALFDELIQRRVQIPADLAAFRERIASGYGVCEELKPMSHEAELVHTLWLAWHRQIDAEGRIDPVAAYVDTLMRDDLAQDGEFLYFSGFDHLLPAEARLVRALCERGQAQIFITAMSAEDPVTQNMLDALALPAHQIDAAPDPFEAALERTYAWQHDDLATRARDFARHVPQDPFADRLSLLLAKDAESHAQGIDIQVRQWLLDGKRHIGIVTSDRRLARRVRALLERAGVAMQDKAGWALSTTSAAAAVERWLQVVEDEFAYQPLLDVLKSPFTWPDAERDKHLANVYRLERDIIRHENIPRDLRRYRQHIDRRASRLNEVGAWSQAAAADLHALLDDLEHAAEPLLDLVHARPARTQAYLDALELSLSRLGMSKAFEADAAGVRILQELDVMRAAISGRQIDMDWLEWRRWLARVLETQNFRPAGVSRAVELIGTEQTHLARFDGLIIAGVDAASYPGAPAESPIFNEGVRHEFSLATWRDTLDQRFHRFRRLLVAAPDVLLTVQTERNAEPVVVSPWLECLRSFHHLAWGTDLSVAPSTHLIDQPDAQIEAADDFGYPQMEAMPAPSAPAPRAQLTLSASAHQRLIDCPYRYFAADCLGLKPPDEIFDALRKSDYGERVHRCLHAFHGDVAGLPGPFRGPVTASNQGAAEDLLIDISQRVFAKDTDDNFLHRAWLHRWLALVPAYIDWQRQRNASWQTAGTELKLETQLIDGLKITARVDRIDRAHGAAAVVDYKTGAAAHQCAVDTGEDVQLTTYAALLDGVERAEFVLLGKDERVKTGACLEGGTLTAMVGATTQRLIALAAAIEGGAPLPAWGDTQTCKYCDVDVICRRQAWKHN